MTDIDQYDRNGNGRIDPEEMAWIELEDRRRKMEDADAQRDQQRKMVWFVLFGMLGYPLFIIVSAIFELTNVLQILGSMASIYFPSTSLILAAFFGASAYQAKKEDDAL
jgi:hypothetical protein